MKNNIFLVLTVVLFFHLPSHIAVAEQKEVRGYRPTLRNVNGTENAYFIKIIELQSVKCLTDKDRNIFLVTNCGNEKELTREILLSSNDCFLVAQDLYWFFFALKYIDYPEVERYDDIVNPFGETSEAKYTVGEPVNDNLSRVNFSKDTKFFMLFLMTGKLYNFLYYGAWFDGSAIEKPLDFPDSGAFYKVLVPIWPK